MNPSRLIHDTDRHTHYHNSAEHLYTLTKYNSNFINTFTHTRTHLLALTPPRPASSRGLVAHTQHSLISLHTRCNGERGLYYSKTRQPRPGTKSGRGYVSFRVRCSD